MKALKGFASFHRNQLSRLDVQDPAKKAHGGESEYDVLLDDEEEAVEEPRRKDMLE